MARRILVAVDNPIQAEHVRLLLEGAGYLVHMAANGREGLQSAQSAPPDLIISDVGLPEVDGYGFCRAVKSDEATKRIPFVLLTKRKSPIDIIHGLEIGADNFITKPFGDEYLLERVRRIFEHLEFHQKGFLEVQVTVHVAGRDISITADKQQIIELLFSSFEELERVNARLVESQRIVERRAEELEAEVDRRTRQLRESEIRFRSAFEDAAIGMAVVATDGRFLQVNRSLCEILGYAEPELLATTFQAITHPDDLEPTLAYARQTLAGDRRSFQVEKRYMHKQGREIWVLLSTSLVRDGRDTPLYFVSQVQDITDRKRAEEALADALKERESIMETVPDILYLLDLGGNLGRWNRRLEIVTGFSHSELRGRSALEFFPEEDRAIIAEAIRTAFDQGYADAEGRLLMKDGTSLPYHWTGVTLVDGHGNVIGLTGVGRDITEQKRAEEVLKASRESYQSLVENSPICIHEIDCAGRVISMNRAGLNMVGATDEGQVRGTAYLDAVSRADRPRVGALLARAFAGESSEFEFVAANEGEQRILASCFIPLRGKGGTVHKLMGITQDITERKQAEQVRQALYRSSLEIQEPMGLRERLDLILQTAQTVLELDRVNIFLADSEGRWLEAVATLGTEEPLEAIRVPIGPGGGGVAQAFRTKQMVIWDGRGPVPGPLRLQPPYDQIEALRSQAFANVPLVVEGRAIGVLGTDRRHSGRPLDRSTLELLQLFASQAAMSIEHARTFERLQFHSKALKRFYEATAQINLSLDLDETLRMIAKAGVEACGSATGNVILFDDEGKISHVALWDPSGVLTPDKLTIRPDGLTRKALRSGKMEIISNFSQEPPGRINPAALQAGRLAAACAPLPLQGGKGVLWVHFNVPHRFTHEETALLQAFAQEAAVAIHKARLFEQVRVGRERLQSLSRRLVELQEAERRHIARELHDEIGQVLTGLQLVLEMGTRVTTAAARHGIGEAKALVHELISRVRELSLDLRPAMLDDLGLLPALLWHIERYTAQTKVKVTFEHAGLETRFSPEAETAAYRIVQEALTNVARHAAVDRATVVLGVTQDMLCLQIQDTGVGFDPQAALVSETSSGLAGMRERATLLGGRLVVESVPGAGTRVTAELPLSDTLERRADAR